MVLCDHVLLCIAVVCCAASCVTATCDEQFIHDAFEKCSSSVNLPDEQVGMHLDATELDEICRKFDEVKRCFETETSSCALDDANMYLTEWTNVIRGLKSICSEEHREVLSQHADCLASSDLQEDVTGVTNALLDCSLQVVKQSCGYEVAKIILEAEVTASGDSLFPGCTLTVTLSSARFLRADVFITVLLSIVGAFVM
ncbi:hypothetical protein CAPTEDRAFT_208064 [Capitella teleta]|uniref:DUF19 domain-containing protein n=1 Tax=Capitella teleta TaxID=283909 RepID=R7UX37_CAPTE|nr:hypothetical protein CAPTEDRAFT_208064 [Capitella teleta]|eukprot:ELU08477.1 hypothetical protein CAPTEDRAFT_208064 [Capitella teleta]